MLQKIKSIDTCALTIKLNYNAYINGYAHLENIINDYGFVFWIFWFSKWLHLLYRIKLLFFQNVTMFQKNYWQMFEIIFAKYHNGTVQKRTQILDSYQRGTMIFKKKRNNNNYIIWKPRNNDDVSNRECWNYILYYGKFNVNIKINIFNFIKLTQLCSQIFFMFLTSVCNNSQYFQHCNE